MYYISTVLIGVSIKFTFSTNVENVFIVLDCESDENEAL